MLRLIENKDFFDWLQLRHALWPYHPLQELEQEAKKIYATIEKHPVFFAENQNGEITGFIELSIHEIAPGCTIEKVGFIEAWYVKPEYRKSGIGRVLIENGEHWAISKGCKEVASDADPHFPLSPVAYASLGYTEVIMSHNHMMNHANKKYYIKQLAAHQDATLAQFSIVNITNDLALRKTTENDAVLIQVLMTKYWGGEPLIVNGEKYYPSKLQGLLLNQGDKVQGMLFYIRRGAVCEIIVFEVFNKFTGLGTIMLNKFIQLIKSQQYTKIQVMTTNDNLDALRFYQRRGFIIRGVRLNILENSRKMKSTIPELGDYNIPLRDEIELELVIG